MDGAVYEWTMKDFKRNKENVIKGCGYNCVLSTPDSHQILAVGSDRKLKEFEESPVGVTSPPFHNSVPTELGPQVPPS
eukprot:1187664-Prorocentrum_minimum.AAC.4